VTSASNADVIRPFRWDITRRSQLGKLADVERPDSYPEFEEDPLTCAARVLAFSGDGDLVFLEVASAAAEAGLEPSALALHKRNGALVDVVATGGRSAPC
jgi:hypothetical protein